MEDENKIDTDELERADEPEFNGNFTKKVINKRGVTVFARVAKFSSDGSGRLDLLIPDIDSGQRNYQGDYLDRKCRYGKEYIEVTDPISILNPALAGTGTGSNNPYNS